MKHDKTQWAYPYLEERVKNSWRTNDEQVKEFRHFLVFFTDRSNEFSRAYKTFIQRILRDFMLDLQKRW